MMLPEWFQQIEEFKQIMAVEGNMLGNVEKDMGKVYQNHFIKTADKEIISDYEGWMEIRNQAGESLDYRRERVLQKLNTLPPFTIWFLRNRLNAVLGEDGYLLCVNPTECMLEIRIISDRPRAVEMVFDLMRDIVPAHLYFAMIRQYIDSYFVKIRMESLLTFKGEFYPRYNLPYLMYDGTAPYNKYKYNGYKTDSFVDLYPTKLSYHISRLFVYDHIPKIKLYDEAKQQIKSSKTTFFYLSEINSKVGIENRLKIKTAHKGSVPTYQVSLTVGKHLTQYNGKYQYNGTRKYDSKIIHEIL